MSLRTWVIEARLDDHPFCTLLSDDWYLYITRCVFSLAILLSVGNTHWSRFRTNCYNTVWNSIMQRDIPSRVYRQSSGRLPLGRDMMKNVFRFSFLFSLLLHCCHWPPRSHLKGFDNGRMTYLCNLIMFSLVYFHIVMWVICLVTPTVGLHRLKRATPEYRLNSGNERYEPG